MRVLGTALAVLAGLGALVPLAIDYVAPTKPQTARDKAIAKANSQCPSLKAMRPVAKLPPAIIFTFADLSPRLITVTHHRAIMGPYHRNEQQIVDIDAVLPRHARQCPRPGRQISCRLCA